MLYVFRPQNINVVQEFLEPAVTGTLNVLKACVEAKVKRVVVVSSIAAVVMNPDWPKGQVKDETCWSDPEYIKTTKVIVHFDLYLVDEEPYFYAEARSLILCSRNGTIFQKQKQKDRLWSLEKEMDLRL